MQLEDSARPQSLNIMQCDSLSMKPIVARPEGEWVPFVASIPHCGEYVPPNVAEELLVEADRNYADWYTSNLYSFLPALGVPTVAATAHRLVADANRALTNPLAAPWPTGVIATTSTRHEPMYAKQISELEIEARVAAGHTSYHNALDFILEEALARFDAIVLLDLHSFGMPLKVDVVLGDRRGATAGEYEMQIIEESFGAHGFSTQRNQPFPGGWIIRRFENNPCIHAIIVELNQRLYLDPAEIDREDWKRPRLVPERMREASKRLKAVLVDIVGGLGEIKPRSCIRSKAKSWRGDTPA